MSTTLPVRQCSLLRLVCVPVASLEADLCFTAEEAETYIAVGSGTLSSVFSFVLLFSVFYKRFQVSGF